MGIFLQARKLYVPKFQSIVNFMTSVFKPRKFSASGSADSPLITDTVEGATVIIPASIVIVNFSIPYRSGK